MSPTLAGRFFTTSSTQEARYNSLVIIYLRLISSDNGRETWWKIFISKYLNKFLSLFQNIKFLNNESFFFNNNDIPE